MPWALAFTAIYTCSRAQGKKEKNRCLTANFAATLSLNRLYVKFCMWSQVVDVFIDAKFYGNQLRGFGVTELPPPKRHFVYLTFITLTTLSALPCCTVIS